MASEGISLCCSWEGVHLRTDGTQPALHKACRLSNRLLSLSFDLLINGRLAVLPHADKRLAPLPLQDCLELPIFCSLFSKEPWGLPEVIQLHSQESRFSQDVFMVLRGEIVKA